MSLLPEKDWANNEIKKDNERQFFVGPPRQNLKWMSIKREKVVSREKWMYLFSSYFPTYNLFSHFPDFCTDEQ